MPIEDAVKQLEKLGAQIKRISLPKLMYGIAAYYILVPSEISSNMARFDGVRFGYRSPNASSKLITEKFKR